MRRSSLLSDPQTQTQAVGLTGVIPEGLHLRGQAGVEHDSNVLRTTSNKISDTAWTAGVGLSFNKRYGLQNVRADIQADGWWYQNQSDLNFNTLNYLLAWDWSLTPRFHGVAWRCWPPAARARTSGGTLMRFGTAMATSIAWTAL